MKELPEGHPYRIAPKLMPMVEPIDRYTLWPNNARQGDIGEIAGSLTDYGQTIPAVVQRSTGRVCKGNNTILAARSLGGTFFAFNVMDLTDAEAHGYYLRDNRTSDLATYDEAQLAADVRAAHEAGYGEATGYSGDDLDDLLRSTGELTLTERPYHRDREGFLDRFLNTTVRQLSMHFNNEEYLEVIARLDRVLTVSGVPTHTNALLFLLEFWEKELGDALPALSLHAIADDEDFSDTVDDYLEEEDDAEAEAGTEAAAAG